MATRFHAVFRYAGVDDGGDHPGMIVPVGGSNLVAVEMAPGEELRSSRPHDLTIKEIGAAEAAKDDFTYERLFGLRDYAAYRDTPVRASLPSGARLFRIGVRKKIAISQFVSVHGSDGSVVEKFPVVGLEKKAVTVAIRPVKVLSDDGKTYVDHAKPGYVLKDIVEQMNLIWHPQANVVFTLVPAEPFRLPSLPPVVVIETNRDVFAAAKERKAKYTMFLVKAVSSSGHDDNGVSDVANGFALLADKRSTRTAAHEAGHLMGSGSGPTGQMVFGHPTKDPDRLMRDGGAARKLTFDEVVSHFNGNY
jgi:hypothetical protein